MIDPLAWLDEGYEIAKRAYAEDGLGRFDPHWQSWLAEHSVVLLMLAVGFNSARKSYKQKYNKVREDFGSFVNMMSGREKRRDEVTEERHAVGVTPDHAAWVIGKVVEAMDIGPSFRSFIYGLMGFGPESYSKLYLAGGMAITNGINDSGELEPGKSVRRSDRRARRWERWARKWWTELDELRGVAAMLCSYLGHGQPTLVATPEEYNRRIRAGIDFFLKVEEKRHADSAAKLAEAEEKAGELQALFNLQHQRSLDAMKRWQQATGRDDVWPDLGEMLKWLLERDDIATSSVETLRDVDECIEAATTQTEILTPEIHAKLLKDARHTISLCLKEERRICSPEVETVDGEVLKIGVVHGPEKCPAGACSDCEGEHHLLDVCVNPEDPGEYAQHPAFLAGNIVFWECKHCPAWAEME